MTVPIYNVGIIGYGWAATAHVAAINATGRARVTAVCSSRKLDPAALSDAHGGRIAVYGDLKAMLARPDIDVVSICSYHDRHAREAIAAARAGKHLIIEKPLTLNLKDLRAMQAAITRADVKTCVCFELRFASQLIATKAIIDAGLLGRVHYAEVDYYHGIGPWYREYKWILSKESCGSSLLAAGCHAMDAMLLYMGSEIESVSSYGTNSTNKIFRKYQYPTTTVNVVKFKDGRVGKVTSCIDCWQPYYFHTHLVGREGSLLDDKFHSTKIAGLNKNKWSTLSMKLADSGDVSDHPYQTQFDAFFKALAEGREMLLTSLSEAARTHDVIFAAERSASLGRPVKLSELRQR
ncbi:MAG: Gfo/Idh/MocA family oxidoreductase [Candidatus Sumerlaeota bacterium]|nr:Gfo/Idh/MocA family oxidoreductase [Candidatus Sumerlaeota bacterium]